MKIGFYPRLAATGMRKNKRAFAPFILACTGMVMMFYIITYLATSSFIDDLAGGETLRMIFSLGSGVIAVFSLIFLFYTNTFLIRRRKKEFGLYNILGMGKQNIARVMFWETAIMAAISIFAGLAAGIIFSKLAELGMVYVMNGKATYTLSVSPMSILESLGVFSGIFLLLLLSSIGQVRFSNAVTLMRSENAGEKPPKGNWFLGMLGIFLLAGAYYIAVTTQNPSEALFKFFIAVIMVIVGTYLVMISGSVLLCRLLQKRKSYYYKPNHFVSVSSMVYRMRRNGAGLASICILATMVLVMMASTACLYFGEEDAINQRYPRDMNLKFQYENVSDCTGENVKLLKSGVSRLLSKKGVKAQNAYFYRSAAGFATIDGGEGTLLRSMNEINTDFSSVWAIYFVPLADYNEIMKTDEKLNGNEAIMYCNRLAYGGDKISFNGVCDFTVKKSLDFFPLEGDSMMSTVPTMVLVVRDMEKTLEPLLGLISDRSGKTVLTTYWIYDFDMGTDAENQIEIYHGLTEKLRDESLKEKFKYEYLTVGSKEFERNSFYGLFGALFYIGIILSLVFILAAVMIMYYKQISEGYEDQSRFEIMQKVGMTKKDIRKTINSQLLTVFFLPLLMAALHIVFAFPIIRKMLLIFNLNNVKLFAVTTSISVLVFALFYVIVYRLTSNAYYNIVSGVKEE